MKLSKTQLTEMVREAVQEQMDGPKPFNEEFPELYEIAKDILKKVVPLINKKAQKVKSKTPYKAQAILESLIQQLEELV